MRVVSLGERVEKQFHLLVLILLVDVAGEPIVAFRDQFRAGLDRVFAKMFLEQLACDPPVPDRIGFSLVFRPRSFLPAQLNSRVVLEIGRLVELLLDLGDAVIHALGVKSIDFVGWLQVFQQNGVIEPHAILRS